MEKIKGFFVLFYSYLTNIFEAITGKSLKKWTVFYIGELGVVKLNFLPGGFEPKERLFYKAEKVEGLQKGTLNDVYNRVEVDYKNRAAIYFKEVDKR